MPSPGAPPAAPEVPAPGPAPTPAPAAPERNHAEAVEKHKKEFAELKEKVNTANTLADAKEKDTALFEVRKKLLALKTKVKEDQNKAAADKATKADAAPAQKELGELHGEIDQAEADIQYRDNWFYKFMNKSGLGWVMGKTAKGASWVGHHGVAGISVINHYVLAPIFRPLKPLIPKLAPMLRFFKMNKQADQLEQFGKAGDVLGGEEEKTPAIPEDPKVKAQVDAIKPALPNTMTIERDLTPDAEVKALFRLNKLRDDFLKNYPAITNKPSHSLTNLLSDAIAAAPNEVQKKPSMKLADLEKVLKDYLEMPATKARYNAEEEKEKKEERERRAAPPPTPAPAPPAAPPIS